MNKNYILAIALIILVGVGGTFLYKKNKSCCAAPIVSIYFDETSENKREVNSFTKVLKSYGVAFEKISNNSHQQKLDTKIHVFFDQKMFDRFDKKDESLLKILVRLKEVYEIQEMPNVVGVFEKDKYSQLIDFIQRIIPNASNILILRDGVVESFNKAYTENIAVYAKAKSINLLDVALDDKKNLSSVLKEIPENIQAVLVIPSEYILKESEVILHHFKNKKIPVFANSSLFIRLGAVAGFDYDNEELFYDIANMIVSFDKNNSNAIAEDALSHLTHQLHVNMDTLRAINLDLDEGILDEAVTVGSADS